MYFKGIFKACFRYFNGILRVCFGIFWYFKGILRVPNRSTIRAQYGPIGPPHEVGPALSPNIPPGEGRFKGRCWGHFNGLKIP